MGLFSKKKKELEIELPPPPPPDSDIIPVKPKKFKLPKIKKKEVVSKPKEMPLFEDKLPPPPMHFMEKEEPIEKMPEPPIHSMEERESVVKEVRFPKMPPMEVEKDIRSEEPRMPPIPNLKELEKELPPVPDLDELEKDLPSLREMGNKEFPTPEFSNIELEREEPESISAAPIKEEVKGPVFVNVNSYKDAISCVNHIRTTIKEGENCLQRLNDIKNSKDKYFEQFRAKLEDLQRKNTYVDKSLFDKKAFL